jgi:hypothetical protein
MRLPRYNIIPLRPRCPVLLAAALLLTPLGPGACTLAPRRTQAAPIPGPQTASDPAALVGEWVGPTEEDGTLTLVLAANGRINYRFSGGQKEHAAGRYVVRGNTLVVIEDGDDEDEAETWAYSLIQGQLRVRMAGDDEVYVLMKRS